MNYIATTTTKTSFSVHAELMLNEYQTGIKIAADEMAARTPTRHASLPELNYTISPDTGERQ